MFKSSESPLYSSEPNQSKATSHAIETVVGPSVVVEGDFSSEGNILVKGTVSGSVKTATRLTVESGARILANVKAGEALIAGEIKGNVRVSGQLELTESARVLGDITCKVLVVAAGALLHGKVTMKDLDKEEEKKPVGRSSRVKKEIEPLETESA